MMLKGGIDYTVLRELFRKAFEVSIDTGNVTTATDNTLTDMTKNWSDNMFSGYIVEIVGGKGAGQIRKITGNTSNTLVVDPSWSVTPDNTSSYSIKFYGKGAVDISSWGGTSLSGRDITADFAKLQNLDILLSSLRDAAYDSVNDRKKISIENDNVGLASEATLSSIDGKTVKVDTDNVKVISEVAYDSVNDRKKISIENDAVGLAKETSVSSILSQLDITLSALRDAITTGSATGATAKALYDLYADLESIKNALASIGTDKLLTTPDNPPNLDVLLSTRASEATLSSELTRLAKLKIYDDTLATPDWVDLKRTVLRESRIIGDDVGLAKDATLTSELTRLAKLRGYDPATATWQDIHTDGANRIKTQLDSIPNPSNLDVALSTRASEATLSAIKGALASVGTDKLLTAPDNPPNLDITLSTLAKINRWGRNGSPSWVHGNEVTGPAAGTALVTHTVTTGKTAYIYGLFITAGEANDFKVNWTSGGTAYSIRIPLSGSGALQYTDFVALNEGLPADGGTDITITNVNAGTGVYQGRLLIMEV